MNHCVISSCCLLAIAAFAMACSHERHHSRPASASAARSVEPTDGPFETPPPRDTVPMVMQAKLAHAQAVLEGIALADFPQIETNALALKGISQGGDWLVQESAAYFDFSAEFRAICDDLANHARAQNLEAAAGDYANLANSCVACHSYLRRERQMKDLPGRISMDGGFKQLISRRTHHGEGVTLVVDNKSFNIYPAALVSLDRAEIIPLPKYLDDMTETDADLWIEPGDPELAAMNAAGAWDLFAGAHVGRDVQLAVVDLDYDCIHKAPADLSWVERLPLEVTKGIVFIVRSSSNQCYKVRIDTWNQGVRKSIRTAADHDKPDSINQSGGLVQLSFARIDED